MALNQRLSEPESRSFQARIDRLYPAGISRPAT
jgi:hypothetical protein